MLIIFTIQITKEFEWVNQIWFAVSCVSSYFWNHTNSLLGITNHTHFIQIQFKFLKLCFCRHFYTHFLTTVRIGSVCVRATINWGSCGRQIFSSSSFCEKDEDCCNHSYNQKKTRNGDTDRKISLWNADCTRIVSFWRLQNAKNR